MAPAKRARTTAAQSTLSFSRTKPAARDAAPAKQAAPPSKPVIVDEPAPETQLDQPADQEEPQDEDEPEDEDEAAARRVTDAQLSRYWAGKEAARTAPRVHQGALGVREKILREFDMQTRFGPSIGIRRVARWKRARDLGMAPPVEVLAVLVGAGQQQQRSIMDELILSSRAKDGD